MKVAIVGAGAMGLAIAWGIVRAGHEAVVFEQGPIPNPLGASVDRQRSIHFPYGGDAARTRMVAEAYRAWETLWDDLGERLYVPTGTLALAAPGGAPWIRDSAAAMERNGHAVRRLGRGDLAGFSPLLATGDIEEAIQVASGGVLLADRIVASLAAHVAVRGARLRPDSRVAEIDPLRARLKLESGERVAADALVVAAGAWVDRLLPETRGRLVPVRQIALYLAPPGSHAARWSIAPLMLVRGGGGGAGSDGIDIAPPVADADLAIFGTALGPAGDPDAPRLVSAAEADALLAAARARLGDGGNRYRVLRHGAGYATVMPEEPRGFLVERIAAPAWILSACAGHGFKFAPLIGLQLAAVIAAEFGDSGALRDSTSLWATGSGA